MNRILSEGKFLKKEDYKLLRNGERYGFEINHSHYFQVHKARLAYNELHSEAPLPVRDDFKEEWETRIGCGITGRPFNTRHHPYQDLRLQDKESGKIYVVDAVYKHHYYGFYITLLTRAEGTQSHGQVIWENISCHDPITLESLQEAKERFIVLEKLNDINKSVK